MCATTGNIQGEGFLLSVYAKSKDANKNVGVNIDGNIYCYVVTINDSSESNFIALLLNENTYLNLNTEGEIIINKKEEQIIISNPLLKNEKSGISGDDKYMFLFPVPFRYNVSLTNTTEYKILYLKKIS